MLVKSHRLSVHFPLPSSMRIRNSEVLIVPSVKNLRCHTLTAWLSMYWTFPDQHTFNSDKLVPYVMYSLLKRLKLSSMLSFWPTWTTATAYSLAVHSFSLTDCRKFRTQMHDLSIGQKNLNMSNPLFSRYTGYQSGHEYSTKFQRFASM